MSRLGSLVTVAVVGTIITLVFVSNGGNKVSVPLEADQSDRGLRLASEKGYRVGMYTVAGLAFVAGAVGAVGITNSKPSQAKATK